VRPGKNREGGGSVSAFLKQSDVRSSRSWKNLPTGGEKRKKGEEPGPSVHSDVLKRDHHIVLGVGVTVRREWGKKRSLRNTVSYRNE